MFSADRTQIRQMYQTSWHKHQQNQPLHGVEQLIVNVIQQHPEYQQLITDSTMTTQEYAANHQGNPFLHMGMHIALAEQLATDRPSGIRALYQQIVSQATDAHQAEHQIIACLDHILHHAQQTNTSPDEQAYLRQLHSIANT